MRSETASLCPIIQRDLPSPLMEVLVSNSNVRHASRSETASLCPTVSNEIFLRVSVVEVLVSNSNGINHPFVDMVGAERLFQEKASLLGTGRLAGWTILA
jgi:hypothetical protein